MDTASGGNVSGRIGSSVKVPNFLCCVCTKENKRSEAVKYCVTCEDYFCIECVTLHNKMPTMSGHVIVGKSDFKSMGGGNELLSIPTVRCATHPAKIIDMYCETHDRMGCATSMATTHDESCTKLHIPENIDPHFDSKKIKTSEKQLRSAVQKVEEAYKIGKKVQTSVKLTSDKNCWIRGSCTLQDGTILLVDANNNCLKRLSPRAISVSGCLQLLGCPWTVAVINQKEAAVTLPDQRKVQIIALDATMKTTKTLNLGFMCYGITYYDHKLFISDYGRDVYVYTLAGEPLSEFSGIFPDFFSDIHNMVMSKSGRVLFIADWNRGLIAVEWGRGRQLWCYTGDDLRGARGVCVDGKGGVFVCGWGSDNVLQFSESGEKMGEIVTRADGIVQPTSVCFVTDTCTLVVAQFRNNVAMQYQLTT